MAEGWIYMMTNRMMTNRPNGILYLGVTDNMPRRAWEHREGWWPVLPSAMALRGWFMSSIIPTFGWPVSASEI
jgi:hypothetical protein